MTAYLYSAVLSSVAYGLLTGLLVKVVVATVYIRGFLAVDAYIEADKAIRLLIPNEVAPQQPPPS
jgi:hypothetical protein